MQVRVGLLHVVVKSARARHDQRTGLLGLTGLDEADLDQNRISWLSPLAKALLNKEAGEVARFRSPMGEQVLTILAVEY